MFQKSMVTVTALIVGVVGISYLTAHGTTTKAPDREADKQAIEKLTQSSIQAFNNRDAAAIAANWTAEGEFILNDGVPIRGQANIQKGYADFFKTIKGKPTVDVQVDNLRFMSNDTALSEVTLRMKNEQGEPIGSSWRNTLLVREDGQWKVSMVQEWDRDMSLDDSLKDVEWLIGTWRMDNKNQVVTTTYEWDDNRAFIRGKFTVQQGGKVTESGTQTLGKDNSEGGIRSWVFQSDGGFGDGLWTRDGKKWLVDFEGVTPDGKKLNSTVVYLRIDPNTFTWQSVLQTVDGQPIPDTQPIRVTRQTGGR
jgi:uncharacterized protein (TIGR02246 family)